MGISTHDVQHVSAAILSISLTKNSMLLVGTTPLDLRHNVPYKDKKQRYSNTNISQWMLLRYIHHTQYTLKCLSNINLPKDSLKHLPKLGVECKHVTEFRRYLSNIIRTSKFI